MDEQAKVTERPNRLKAKVVGLGSDEPLAIEPDLLAEADNALAQMEEQYETWLEQDVTTIANAVNAAEADPSSRAEQLKVIADTAHNVKGQGATFGYDLAGEIAASLHAVAQSPEHVEDVHVAIMRAHVDVLRVVQAQKLKGDGGELGATLKTALNEAVEKHAAAALDD